MGKENKDQDKQISLSLTDKEWMQLLDGNCEYTQLQSCCANISALRDELGQIVREGRTEPIMSFYLSSLKQKLMWVMDGHELSPLLKKVCDQIGFDYKDPKNSHAFQSSEILRKAALKKHRIKKLREEVVVGLTSANNKAAAILASNKREEEDLWDIDMEELLVDTPPWYQQWYAEVGHGLWEHHNLLQFDEEGRVDNTSEFFGSISFIQGITEDAWWEMVLMDYIPEDYLAEEE